MDITPFKKAFELLEIIEKHHYEAYIVGGSVRDFLLNRQIKDIDIATSATPQQLQVIFPKVIPVGIEHGTVVVIHRETPYEVTTFRSGKIMNEHSFSVDASILDLKTDVSFRDFTMNAMAMDKNGNIIDYYAGKQDLQNKTIRAVENPTLRIMEDPLRMLRAIRFASQLGFDIERETLFEIQRLKEKITQIPVERIYNEFSSLLKGKYIEKGIYYLLETSLIHYLPVFKDENKLIDTFVKICIPFASFSQFIALFHYLHPNISINRWARSWKCSNQEKKDALNLHDAIKEYEKNELNNWLIYQLNDKLIDGFINLVKIIFNIEYKKEQLQTMKKNLVIQSRSELSINGKVLLQIFPDRKAGSWIESILLQVEKAVIMGHVENDKEKIKEWILCHPPAIN